MRRELIAGLVSGAVLVASVPAVVTAGDGTSGLTNRQLIDKCIKQANAELAGTGKSIKKGQFDTIVIGTPGDDDFSGYPPVSPGRDLFCGFGGNDIRDHTPGAKLGWGDVFVGGSGRDDIINVDGGVVIGGGGSDSVKLLDRGLFVGGDGNDAVFEQRQARFYGRNGADGVDVMYPGARFLGNRGVDHVATVHGGTFWGGADDDFVNTMLIGGLFYGGGGDDRVNDQDGDFRGGDGSDYVFDVIGNFHGDAGRDEAMHVHGWLYGGPGWDVVQNLFGTYRGGKGSDRLDVCLAGGQTFGVERGAVPCPHP